MLAFIIRYAGIKFGFPLITHPDEPKIVNSAINMLQTGVLNPHFFKYPSLFIYMQAIVYLVIFSIGKLIGIFQNFSDIEITTLYFYGRMLTIILSIVTIYLTYLIGCLLFNKMSAIVSSLFISFSYLHIINSVTITVDSPMAFWVILSCFISVLNYTHGPKLKYYLLNGIFIGFAIGTKYTAFLCALPMIYVHLHHVSFSPRKMIDGRLFLGLFLIPIAFILTTPFSIIDYKSFSNALLYEARHYTMGHPGCESGTNSYGFYLASLVSKYGIIPLIVTSIGILFLWIKGKSKAVFLMCFPLFYYLFVGRYRVHFDRNMVVLIPFLALFGGYGVSMVIDYLKKGRLVSNLKIYRYSIYVLLIVLLGVGIYGQAYKALTHIQRIRLPDTRWVSKIWIERNIPHGSKIGREHYTPPIESQNYRVTYLGYFGLITKRLNNFDYIIASSDDYARFVTNEKRYPSQAQKYKEIFSKYELIKEFTPDKKKMTGPVIRIYKIQ